MKRVFENQEGTAFLAKCAFPKYELLAQCVREANPLLEDRPEVVVFGKVCRQHRRVGFFSDKSQGYNYSNKLMASNPFTPNMSELLQTVNSLLNTEFNGMLVNTYKDGSDYIGAHSDSDIGTEEGVASLSFGAERNFRIRNKSDKKILHEEITTDGTILVMGGVFQKLYTHEIPVQKKIKGSRTSITFRTHTK